MPAIGAMTMRQQLWRTSGVLALGLVLANLNACDLAPQTGGSVSVLEVLDEQGQVFREQFNRDAGKVRLLFILDPACSTCLRGLADLDEDVLRSLPPSTAVYLVHVPVIGGKESLIPGAAGLVHNANARHYWDPSGSFGRAMGKQLHLRRNGDPVFAWDVWMVYGPEAVWNDRPPQPRLLMHQLTSIDAAPNVTPLDSKAFGEAVKKIEREQLEGQAS